MCECFCERRKFFHCSSISLFAVYVFAISLYRVTYIYVQTIGNSGKAKIIRKYYKTLYKSLFLEVFFFFK